MSSILSKAVTSDNVFTRPDNIMKYDYSGRCVAGDDFVENFMFGNNVESDIQTDIGWSQTLNSGAIATDYDGYVEFTGGDGGGYSHATDAYLDTTTNAFFMKVRINAFNPYGTVILKTGGATNGIHMIIDETTNKFRLVIYTDSVISHDQSTSHTPILGDDYLFFVFGGGMSIINLETGFVEHLIGFGSNNYNFLGTSAKAIGVTNTPVVEIFTNEAKAGLIGRLYHGAVAQFGAYATPPRTIIKPSDNNLVTDNNVRDVRYANQTTADEMLVCPLPREAWEGQGIINSELVFIMASDRATPLAESAIDMMGVGYECMIPLRYMNQETISVKFKTKAVGPDAVMNVQVWDYDTLVETKKVTVSPGDIVAGATFDLPASIRTRSYSERVVQGEDNMWIAIGIEYGFCVIGDPIVYVDDYISTTDYF